MGYGDVPVLHGVDLEIRRGEVCALVGPNGAGKTTTVEILEGYPRHWPGWARDTRWRKVVVVPVEG